MKRSFQPPVPVRIIWDDAWADTLWFSPEEVQRMRPYEVESVGFLTGVNEDGIAISEDIFREPDKSGYYHKGARYIPWGIVKAVVFLHDGKQLTREAAKTLYIA